MYVQEENESKGSRVTPSHKISSRVMPTHTILSRVIPTHKGCFPGFHDIYTPYPQRGGRLFVTGLLIFVCRLSGLKQYEMKYSVQKHNASPGPRTETTNLEP